MSAAPPAFTLMLYHFLVGSPPSQGNGLPSFAILQPVRHQSGLVPMHVTTSHLEKIYERERLMHLFVAVLIMAPPSSPKKTTGLAARGCSSQCSKQAEKRK